MTRYPTQSHYPVSDTELASREGVRRRRVKRGYSTNQDIILTNLNRTIPVNTLAATTAQKLSTSWKTKRRHRNETAHVAITAGTFFFNHYQDTNPKK